MSQSTLAFAAVIILGILAVGWLDVNRRKIRHQRLTQRFLSKEIATAIMRRRIWQGMTSDMLQESRGKPDERDQSVFKAKIKETWKYEKVGKNRFKLRVMLENGVVVGWK